MTDFAFLHGGGQGGWVWNETVLALRMQAGDASVRTLQLDVPGCGAKRARDIEAITVDEIARELIADIEAAGLRDVVMVGHSQAGEIVPILVKMRPDLFSRLIYVSCLILPPGKTLMEQLGNGLHGTNEEEIGWPFEPGTLDMADAMEVMFMNDMGPEKAAAFSAMLGKDNWPPSSYTHTDWQTEHLGAHPSTYVLCLEDRALTPHWQARFAERAKVHRLLRVDAGHQVMNTRPHALAEILLQEAPAAVSN